MPVSRRVLYVVLHRLTQFEVSHYTDVDKTFIALLSLIPVTEELITLTLDRLFVAPTCARLSVPFVHTVDCWTVVLSYVSTPIVIRHLKNWLSSLQIVPSGTRMLSNDFTYTGRNGISNLGSTCYVNALLQVLNAFAHISLK
jgi:hypothetical protein